MLLGCKETIKQNSVPVAPRCVEQCGIRLTDWLLGSVTHTQTHTHPLPLLVVENKPDMLVASVMEHRSGHMEGSWFRLFVTTPWTLWMCCVCVCVCVTQNTCFYICCFTCVTFHSRLRLKTNSSNLQTDWRNNWIRDDGSDKKINVYINIDTQHTCTQQWC